MEFVIIISAALGGLAFYLGFLFGIKDKSPQKEKTPNAYRKKEMDDYEDINRQTKDFLYFDGDIPVIFERKN